MAGFVNRDTRGNFMNGMSQALQGLSDLGLRYKDQVVKNSKAVGVTEAMFGSQGYMPEDFQYSLAMADVGQKKYVPFFDKEYRVKRDGLRKFACNPEVEYMLDLIADESIVYDNKNRCVYPDDVNLRAHMKAGKDTDRLIEKLDINFNRLLACFNLADDISLWQMFKQYLIDGVLAYELIYDEDGKKIIGWKELDAASVRPGVEKDGDTYRRVWYQYEETPSMSKKFLEAQIVMVSYARGNMVSRISYLERLVRDFNLLRALENSRVIWNLMNSAYRLKMTIPTGTKSPQKAKEVLFEALSKFKEDIYVDPDDGNITVNGRPGMTYYRNFLFPSKNGDSPQVDVIGGEGPDLSNMEPLKYFEMKLRKASRIPQNRFDTDSGATLVIGGDGTEREEMRFGKFINRLRSGFMEMLLKPLYIQMILDFPELKDDEQFRVNLGIRFNKENVFEEMRDNDIQKKRMEMFDLMKGITEDDGTTQKFSTEYLLKKYRVMDDNDLKEAKAAKDAEKREAGDAGGTAAAGDAGAGTSSPSLDLNI